MVDWGNCVGKGFNGLTADESSFQNAQFKRPHPRFGATNFRPQDLIGHQHVVPFDGTVYPLLPRQIVPDLFNLSATDAPLLRSAQRRGFYEVCEQAMALRRQIPSILEATMAGIFKEGMAAKHVTPLNNCVRVRQYDLQSYAVSF